MRGAFVAAVAAALLSAAPASAGAGGTWTPVTPDYDQNFNLVGLHRTADGVLHVAAQQHSAANPQHGDFIHVPVSPGGGVGSATVISGDWEGTNSPDITANQSGGLLAIWGGIHTVTTGDPLNNGSFAVSDDSGTAWTVDPGGPWPTGGTASGTYVYAAQISAGNGSDGTPFEAWSHGGLYVHRGLDPNAPISDFNASMGGQTTAIPDLALDAGADALWVGWENNLDGPGVWAQQVDQATGAPVGSPLQMPGSVTTFNGSAESIPILGRTPITGRPGRPGVWMAYPVGYPSANKLVVWKVGETGTTTLADGADEIRHVAITSESDGRVIVAWGEQSGGAGRIFVRVSSTDVSSWGPAFEVKPPAQATSAWALQASAQSGALVDLVSNFSENTGTPMRFWHTQALAPPVLGKAVNARVVSGEVFVKLPGSSTFARVTHDSQIPVGATVDATRGRVRIVTAVKGGGLQSSDFFQGVFVVTQAKTGLATMALAGGNFAACGRARRGASAAKTVTVRKLWGAGKGKFRTKGRYAAAAIRGTTWLTADRCDGTLVRVTQGAVTVRDLVKKRNVVVTKGHSYLARR